MLEKREHIDELFSEYLGDYQEKVPGYVWHNIQTDLYKNKFRKRIYAIRAFAAAFALLVTFSLGYFSSDFVQKKKYETIYLNIDKDSVLGSKKNQQDNKKQYTKVATEKLNKQIRKSNFSVFPIKEIAQNNSIIFKLFDTSNDNFSLNSQNQKDSEQTVSGTTNLKEKTANQLLIDTLLFKKEDLSERGFLLSEKKDNQSRWSFGTKFSPVYSMAENIKQPQIENDNIALKSARYNPKPDTKADEKALMSFTGGFNINYHFTKRWSIESGLFYSQQRQMAENLVGSSIIGYQDEMMVYTPEGIKYLQPNNFSSPEQTQIIGTAQDETFYSLNMDYLSNFEYIELPLIVRYKVIDKRFGLDILSGFSTNFLVGNKSSITYNDNDLWSGMSEGISPMLYYATVGLGLNYNIYQNLSFNLEPTFKYSIIPTESSNLIRYPYSFAVFAGFSFRF